MQDIGMIEYDNLSFRYEGAGYSALNDINGKVEKGRCVVLCGSSGCGKSTLLRCADLLIPQFYDGTLKGSCILSGHSLDDMSIGEAGRIASSVFQDPRSQFFTLSSTTEVAFGLENFGYSHDEMVRRVDDAFRFFHMENLRDRNVFELSSGERQLVAILASWAMDTDIMLLDEPTANLDYAAVERLRNVLLDLKKQGKTLLISEHRLYYLRDVADEYWFMEHGEIVRKYTQDEMLSLSKNELYSMGLRASDLDTIKPEDKDIAVTSQMHEFRAENICCRYSRTDSRVLDDMTVTARTGEVTALVGHNGCGKTTFGKLCAGLIRPEEGKFFYDDRILDDRELVQNSIFIMQEAEFQFFTNTVMNEICYGHKDDENVIKEAERLLKMVGMWQCRNQHPFSLSGGQMQKLVLILACMSKKPIVILDEPTAGLDAESLKVCSSLIREMAEDRIVMVITHDMELMALACTRCISIVDGRAHDEYDLNDNESFERLRTFMKKGLKAPERKVQREKVGKHLLDPRSKLFILLVSMIAAIGADTHLILSCFIAVSMAILYERRYQIVLVSSLIMGSLFLMYEIWPNAGTSFLLYFFPRIILLGASAALVAQKSEASRSLAALRKMHIPERVILIFSVVFRFFPVLNKDLGIMKQSMKTRGFFPTFMDRVRAIPSYAEIMIVPMVFRVIRIAEALSASAETRGIALNTGRDCFVSIRMRYVDWIMMALTVIMASLSMII